MSDSPLTRRETEVLGLLAEGLSNDEIAANMVISPNTVKVHLRNVFEKMGVQSRTEATMEAVRRGWIAVPGLDLAAATVEPPSWPALTLTWSRWQSAGLAAMLVLALLMAFWPNRSPGAVSAVQEDLTTDLGLTRTTPPPRLDTARWSPGAAMTVARSRAAAGVIDGRLYVVGGETEAGDSDVVERYDADFDAWQLLPPRPVAARGAAAASVDEQLFVAGGCSGSQVISRFDRYDVPAQSWQALTPLPEARCGLALAAVGESLYALGGWDGVAATDSLFIYDVQSDRWQEGRRLPAARAFAAAVAIDEQIYLLGGHDGSQQRPEIWVYDPAADAWAQAPPLPEARSGLTASAEGNDIYVIGGGEGVQPYLHERFDIDAQAWSTLDAPRSGPWHHAVAAVIGSDLHIVGGWGGDYLSAHEVYQTKNLLFLPAVRGN